jgi:hypothetical protein
MAVDEEIDATITGLHHFLLHGRFPTRIPPSLQVDDAIMLEMTVGVAFLRALLLPATRWIHADLI